ncbi:MAG: hypothetical protein KBT03_02205 [Bacteroidales bacterium]|nr:hypothetical protein [Candidatus Scybalousia scybalohippi]
MKINEKEYKLKYTGRTLVIYKEEFGKDLILECKYLKDNFNFVSVFEICWAMAKTYDDSIPSFNEFMDSIDDVQNVIMNGDLLAEMGKVIDKDGSPTKELKKK